MSDGKNAIQNTNDEQEHTIATLQRQQLMYEILNMLLFDKNEEAGRKYFLEEVLKEKGVHRNTWYDWLKKGWLNEVMADMHRQVEHYGQTYVIGMYPAIISAVAALAQGKAPEDSKVKPTANGVVEAAKFIQENVINRMQGALGVHGYNPHEFLAEESLTPQQVTIYVGEVNQTTNILEQQSDKVPDFVYRGNQEAKEVSGSFLNYGDVVPDEEQKEEGDD